MLNKLKKLNVVKSRLVGILYPAIIIVFFAFTFQSIPPGWYQQQIPVNDQINDIYFVDSLTGWLVTNGNIGDSGYILKTTNGGDNWIIQAHQPGRFYTADFPSKDTGYALAAVGVTAIYKTTNSGLNWLKILQLCPTPPLEVKFINNTTGWFCSDDNICGGLFKTTNGGLNWIQQRNQNEAPTKISFINADTGWMVFNGNQLHKTTNGGTNWFFQLTSNGPLYSIFFLNGQKGWAGGRVSGPNPNNIIYTTNGGNNWTNGTGKIGAYDVHFVNDSVGWAGGDFYIIKSTDGGKTWGQQNIPPVNPITSIATLRNDTLHVWAGKNGLMHTSDGGGPITYTAIEPISNIIPDNFKLFQNYPNPFNPTTKIRFDVKSQSSNVKLQIFDVSGKEVSILVNEILNIGEYQIEFSGSRLTSGIYFYSLYADNKLIDTKKMLLIK